MQARIIWKEGTTIKKMPPPDWLGKPMEHFLDWWLMWEAQLTVGIATSRLVVLDGIRKHPEQAMRSKPVYAVLLHGLSISPASRILLWVPAPTSQNSWLQARKWINPFLPKLFLVIAFYHKNRSPKTYGGMWLYTHSICEAKAGGMWVWGQPRLHNETLPQKAKITPPTCIFLFNKSIEIYRRGWLLLGSLGLLDNT